MHQKRSEGSLRLDRHFAACAAFTLSVVALSATQTAQAGITYVVPASPIDIPATFSGVYVNLEPGATGTSSAAVPGWDANPYQATSQLDWFGSSGLSPGVAIAASAVDGGLVQSVAAPTDLSTLTDDPARFDLDSAPAFYAGGLHFVAIHFPNGANAAQQARVEVSTTASDNGRPAAVTRWAYAPIGETPLAGQTGLAVPEAGTTAAGIPGLLAAGAAGIRHRHQVS